MQRQSLLSGRSVEKSVGEREVVDPWTGKAVAVCSLAGPEVVEAALASAWAARASCAALAPWERAQILDRVADGVRARHAELTEAILTEVGKPIRFARGEVDRCIQTLRFAAEEARRPKGEVIALDAVPAGAGRTGIVRAHPAGVVVAIAPFNFPLNLVAHKLAPALAAGCPIIIKPPPQAPTCALILGQLAIDAGWPADGLHVLLLDNTLSQRLVEDERPAILSFTGSDTVGWRLKALAGRKRVLLELGGSAPVIVHRDADLDLAASRIPIGGLAYAGQVCISVQRVLVHDDVADALRERLVAAVQDGVPWGNPRDEDTVSGPVIDESAADRVQSWLDQAEQAGARRLGGGGREGVRLLRPALYEGVPHDQPAWQRELFGPAIMLENFNSVDQALALANAGPWGLQAGVFTSDVQDLMRFFDGLEVGGVIHDDVPTFRVDHMPYGGVKASGLGREGLRYAIADFSEPRMLALRVR